VYSHGSRIVVDIGGLDEGALDALEPDAIARFTELEFLAVDDRHALSEPPPGVELERAPFGSLDEEFYVAQGDGARERLVAFISSLPPIEGRRLAVGPLEDRFRSYVLILEGGLAGRVHSAEPGTHAGDPVISVEFSREGGEIPERLSRRHAGHRLAIVIDGEVVSAPLVEAPITDGRAMITLRGSSPEQARELADQLDGRSLPGHIALAHQSIVRPSLPSSARTASALAAALALALLAGLLATRYRIAGPIWVLAGSASTTAMALAGASALGVVVTIPFVGGLSAGVLVTLAAGIAHFELVRRGHRHRNGFLIMVVGIGLSMLVGLLLIGAGRGLAVSFAWGLFTSFPGAAFACALGAAALARAQPLR
jgi:hypothetical protein